MPDVPPSLLKHLQHLEPSATFTFTPPLATSSSGATYYAKLGCASEAEQYIGEFESLKAINVAAPGFAPQLRAFGITRGEDGPEGLPFLISDYKHLNRLSDTVARRFAERVALELHAYKSTKGFGFHVPTYCGATRLTNGWFETWEACYSNMIGELLEGLRQKGKHNTSLCEKGEQVREKVIPFLLGPLVVEPVLLHGDLWSGNTGTDTLTNEPIVYDPASFYGHNEADLAIARIFGGIPTSFFDTYHQHFPKTNPADQYQLRVDLYELFHYLNHALIFGGAGYSSSALQKMDRLLRYCR